MSCLDVMYQVYGPPQPYFAAAYTPYHQVRGCSGGAGTSGAPQTTKEPLPERSPEPLSARSDRQAVKYAGMPGAQLIIFSWSICCPEKAPSRAKMHLSLPRKQMRMVPTT